MKRFLLPYLAGLAAAFLVLYLIALGASWRSVRIIRRAGRQIAVDLDEYRRQVAGRG